MTRLISQLRAMPLFATLSDEALERLAGELTERNVQRDEQIVLEGEPAEWVYLIAAGQMRVYRLSPEGREQVLTYLGPGEVFHLVAAVDGGPQPANTSAWTAGTLYLLRRERFLALVRQEPELALALLRRFATRLRLLTRLAEELGVWTVRARLARLLLQQAHAPEQAAAPARRLTHEEMAAQIGTVREVVSRTLRAFEEEELIRMQRHRIIVQDPVRLAQIAGEME